MQPRDYLRLWRVARRRFQSEVDYQEFQAFQAGLLTDYLTNKGVQLIGRKLLDLGSGVAGYSKEFARRGAQVIALDLVYKAFGNINIDRVGASAEAIPFSNESIEIVFCASLIEHVANPQTVLAEVERILRPGGFAYFSFPPFYSPMGGHEYAPYHYFGEALALRLVEHRRALPEWVSNLHSAVESPRSFADLYKGWGLYRMTIRKFRQLLRRSRFVCLDISTRYLPISFVRWPVIGELLTWHAQFLLRKALLHE